MLDGTVRSGADSTQLRGRINNGDQITFTVTLSNAGPDAATPGEAKNSWLTGTAAWAFVSGTQGLLGIVPDYDGLRIDPCIPRTWEKFRVTRRFRGVDYEITVTNPAGLSGGVRSLRVDGNDVPGNLVPLAAGRDRTTLSGRSCAFSSAIATMSGSGFERSTSSPDTVVST